MKLSKILSFLLSVMLAGSAFGQTGVPGPPSNPGPMYAPNWYQGYVPTPYEWQTMWSNKISYFATGIPIQFGGTGATNAAAARAALGVVGTGLNSGQIYVGNASNIAAAVNPTGDLNISNAGIFTVTKTNGNLFTYFATGTDASHLTGTVPVGTLPVFDSTHNGVVTASGGGSSNFLRADGTWQAPPGFGTVTSVAMMVPGIMAVGGSPITGAGTLALTLQNQNPNLVWAGPVSGGGAAPTFRALVAADIPSGLGYVTSVGLSLPSSVLTVAGSPVTSSGTLSATFANQSANTFFSGPSNGGSTTPTFRSIVGADLPFTQNGAGAIVTNLIANSLQWLNASQFGTLCDWTVVPASAVTISSGSGALTVAGGVFTAGDVGKTIYVPGAGAAGGLLTTTIATYTNSSHIGLTANASTALVASSQVISYGTTDDTTHLQNALTGSFSQRLNLQLPGGVCKISSELTVGANSGTAANAAIIVRGQGPSMNSGSATQNNGTVILVDPSYPFGDVFLVNSFSGMMFADFQIYSAAKRTGGGGIHLDGLTGPPITSGTSRIDNIAFINQYDGIDLDNTIIAVISRTYHQGWANKAISSASNSTNETGGGEIFLNYFFGDQSPGTTQVANFYAENGYFNFHNNTTLGSQSTIQLNFKNFPAGSPTIFQNVIEDCVLHCIQVLNTGGSTALSLDISQNEFQVSGADTGPTLLDFINIATNNGGSGSYIDNVIIALNKFTGQMTYGGSQPYFVRLNSGTNVQITNNLIKHYSGDTGIEYTVGAEAVSVFLLNNTTMNQGSPPAKYGALTTATTVVDYQGLAFAALPSTVGNGSTIWVTDGTVGSSQNLAASGSGVQAFRYNSAWQPFGRTEGQTPASKGGTGQDFSSSTGVAQVTAGTWSVSAILPSSLAAQGANTVLGNATSGSAAPTALGISSCSSASTALIWTTNMGFGCNSSITAAAVPASGLTGGTLASGVIASSLTSVGTIATGAWQGTIIAPTYGGLGLDTHSSTGVPTVSGGTWSVSATLPCVDHPTLTGDITTPSGSCVTTLAAVATGATTGSSTAIPVVTFNNKGLVTGITTAAVVAPAGTLSGTTLNSTVVSSSLTSLGTVTSGVWNAGAVTSSGNITANGGTIDVAATSADSLMKIETTSSGNAKLFMYTNGNEAYEIVANRSANYWSFGINGTDYFRINPNSSTTDFQLPIKVAGMANAATTSAVCYNTGTGLLSYDGTLGTCTVSAMRFKTPIGTIKDADALAGLNVLRPAVWQYKKDSNLDDRVHVGLYADDVEKMDKRCVAYKDGELQNYEDRCVIAYLAGALKELKASNDNLAAQVEVLKRAVK